MHKPITADVRLNMEREWWLERFFRKHDLSFGEGILLVYLMEVIPSVLFLPWLMGQAYPGYLSEYVFSFLGNLFVPICLILTNYTYKSLVKLADAVDDNVRENRFAAPPVLITEKELNSSDALNRLDKKYSNLYVKPIMLETLRSGLRLAFDKFYQLGSGGISMGLFLFINFLGFVVKIFPGTFFRFEYLGSPEISAVSYGLGFYTTCAAWFTIGMLTWTLFTTFLCTIHVAGNPIKTRPFEPIKESFGEVSTLIMRTSLTVTFAVAWASPFDLLAGILPRDPIVRQNWIIIVESMLFVMIPVIILSFVIPLLEVHKGMTRTRKRLLRLKLSQLEEIKKHWKSGRNEYLMVQRHMISDYKDIQRNSVWLFDFRQVLQIAGSILLPIVTFWLSVQFR